MGKKIAAVIGTIVIVALIATGIYYFMSSHNTSNSDTGSPDNNPTASSQNNQTEEGNMLVVYYSAQGHTEEVANQIASNLGADIFEITPVDAYTSDDLDWTDDNSRVSREHNDESLRNVELTTTEVPNWDNYDTILLGYPIWWGEAAWPVSSFVASNDFTGKTVIPFCTSASSSIGQSDTRLAELAGTGNWQSGHRFSSNASTDEIKQFTDSL